MKPDEADMKEAPAPTGKSKNWRKLATTVKFTPKPNLLRQPSNLERLFVPPTIADGELPDDETQLEGDAVSVAPVFGKGEDLLALVRRDWCVQRFNWLIMVILVLFMFLFTPAIIAHNEKWSFSSSFYFCVQAALGIGFGDLNISRESVYWLMIVELVVGSLFVAFVASVIITYYFDPVPQEEIQELSRPEASKTAIGKEPSRPQEQQQRGSMVQANILTIGQTDAEGEALRSLCHGLLALFAVITAGVVYGLAWSRWNFVTSLLFIISACQTSGLIEPGITPRDGTWPSMFIAFLCVFGVPIWSYCMAKLAMFLAYRQQGNRRLLFAADRQRKAEEAYAARHHVIGKPLPRVDHAGLLELYLLRNGKVTEEALAAVRREFEGLQADVARAKGMAVADAPPAVELRIVSLRLRFLQLVALGLVETDTWEASLKQELAKSE